MPAPKSLPSTRFALSHRPIFKMLTKLISDGTAIKPPYVVKAIGNPQELSNAVDIAGGVGAQLQVKYGANVNLEASDNVIIDEVREATQNKYAKTVE